MKDKQYMNDEMFDELVESMKEAGSISKGEAEPSRVFSYSPMNIKEIREKSSDDLKKTMDEMKVELFDLRFARATGSIENPMRIRELKKSIARILTVLHEREAKEG